MGRSFPFCGEHSGNRSVYRRSVYEEQASDSPQKFLSRERRSLKSPRGMESRGNAS